MNNQKAIQEMLSLVEFSLEKLVEFSEKNCGFMGDDGAYGLTYPHDVTEYDIKHEGRLEIPQGMVEIHYWDNGEQSIIVSLKEYIDGLKLFLKNKLQMDLFERVSKIKIDNE
jgi:hypothetical protein